LEKKSDEVEQIQFYARDPIKKALIKIDNIIGNLMTFEVIERKTQSDYEMFVPNTIMSNMGEVVAGGRNLEDLINFSKEYIRQLTDAKAVPFPIALQCHQSLSHVTEISRGMQARYSSHHNFQGDHLQECQEALKTFNAMSRVLVLVDGCVSRSLFDVETAFTSLKELELASKEMEETGKSQGFMREALSKEEAEKIKDSLRQAIMKG